MSNKNEVAVQARLSLQDLVKAASEGAFARSRIDSEARRHIGDLGETKTASERVASDQMESVPTDYVLKLAAACDEITGQIAKEASEVGPGKGPNTLPISETKGGPAISEDSGKAKNQPPAAAVDGQSKMVNDEKSPPGGGGEQKVAKVDESEEHAKKEMAKLDKIEDKVEQVAEKKAENLHPELAAAYAAQDKASTPGHRIREALSTIGGGVSGAGLGTGLGLAAGHGLKALGLGVDPNNAALLGGAGGAILGGGLGRLAGGNQGQSDIEAGKALEHALAMEQKHASALRSLLKVAEDALNPAQISAGKEPKVPAGVSDSSQPGGSVSPHVGSNEEAASMSPRDAQAQPKKDMKAYIDEPMQTSSTDKVLNNAFANTGKAEAKIASDQQVSAAKELLARLTGKGA